MVNQDFIYGIVPEEHIKAYTDRDVRMRIEYLLRSMEKPLTAREIAKSVGLPVRGTQVEVRKAVTELIEIDHVPIISLSNGFMLAKNKRMVDLYCERLESRILGIRRRIFCLKKIRDDYPFSEVEK